MVYLNRFRWLLFSVFCLSGFAGTGPIHQALDGDQIRERSLSYAMMLRGNPVGTSTFATSFDGGDLVFKETAVIAPYNVDAVTEVHLDRGDFTTKSYRGRGNMFGNPVEIDMVWRAGKVTGTSLFPRGKDEPQGKIEVDRTLPTDCFERTSVFFLCHAMPLKANADFSIPWYNPYDDTVKTIRVTVEGEAKVTTAAGKFDTWKVGLNGGKPSQVVYITRETPRKIVKIEVVDQPWTYELLPQRQVTEKATTLFLLRHAEKGDDDPRNPSLSEAGKARAARLATMLADVPLKNIYTTAYKRTEQTIAGVAEHHQIEPTTYDPTSLPDLIQTLRQNAGKHLIVGHSNTTPALIRMLGLDPGQPFREADEFDRLYIVTLHPDGNGNTISLLRY